MEGGGGGEKRKRCFLRSLPPFPPPPSFLYFFALVPIQLSRRTRAETLAMQANFDTSAPGTHASYPLTL